MDTSTILSRLQSAFTLSFHYIFPQLAMGLALLILILKTLYLRTRNERYNVSARFWARLFAISFIWGVVPGIPLAGQFGTHWGPVFSLPRDLTAERSAREGAR